MYIKWKPQGGSFPELPCGFSVGSFLSVIPEKDPTVLLCCRSGNRSKAAADTLVKLGYTKVYEFGGINTWPYDIKQ